MTGRVAAFLRRRGALDRYLGSGESVLLATRQHPFIVVRDGFSLLGWFAPLLLLTWGLAGLDPFRGVAGDWLLRLLFVLMAGVVVLLMQRLLVWEFERVVVTNEKVIHVSGVLSKRIASTPLAKVSEFTVHQTLLGRVAGFGSLVVDVPGGRDQALHGLAFIPDPAGMYRLVSDQGRRARHGEHNGAGGGKAAHNGVPDSVRAPEAGPGGYPLRVAVPLVELELDAHPGGADRGVGQSIDHTIEIARPDSLR